MAGSLQHCQATQFPWIQAAGAKIHRPDRPKADNALTFKLDHLTGADHDIGCGTCTCHFWYVWRYLRYVVVGLPKPAFGRGTYWTVLAIFCQRLYGLPLPTRRSMVDRDHSRFGGAPTVDVIVLEKTRFLYLERLFNMRILKSWHMH